MSKDLVGYELLTPKLLPGKIVQVNDMLAVIELKGRMGMLHLPLRSFIANEALEKGDAVEIYISYAKVTKNKNL